MGKRLITTNNRAELIIRNLKNAGISTFVNTAIIDATIPIYSQYLRKECLWLIDVVTDGAQDWRGNKLQDCEYDPRNNITDHVRSVLGRGVTWLKKHHIKDESVLRHIIKHYACKPIYCNDGHNYNNYVCDQIKNMIDKIKSIDTNYKRPDTKAIGVIACDVINHWSNLWDDNASYDILISCILLENIKESIEPMDAIHILQNFESQFILEYLSE